MFTEEEEDILKLFIAEMTTKLKFNVAREADQVKNLPLQNAHAAAQIALKAKIDSLVLVTR